MWIVAKIKKKSLLHFKSSIEEKLKNEVLFYQPKVLYEKRNLMSKKFTIYTKFILGNYIFCKHDKFKNFTTINQLKYIKGLEYFLNGYISDQQQIISFINFCKRNEDENGSLKHTFFYNFIPKKGSFLSGHFANLIFEIISFEKNKLEALFNKKLKVKFDLTSNKIFLPAY